MYFCNCLMLFSNIELLPNYKTHNVSKQELKL